MTSHNVALVFAPSLLRPPASGNDPADLANELAQITPAARLITTLIQHRDEVFASLSVGAGSAGLARVADAATASTGEVAGGGDGGGAGPESQWWYSQAGEQKGPVSAAELAALLASGVLKMTSWVFEGNTADWQELSKVKYRLPRLSTI